MNRNWIIFFQFFNIFIGLFVFIYPACSGEKGATQMSKYELAEIFATEDHSKRLELLKQVYDNSDEYGKFLLLPKMGKTAIMAKDFKIAGDYAERLLLLEKKYPASWNYGNAIHDANIVLGMIALKNKNIQTAKRYLLKAGNAPESPQLRNFGPNMMLAKALLDKGERQIVIDYFQSLKNLDK